MAVCMVIFLGVGLSAAVLDYPIRPIQVTFPFSLGGEPNIMARSIAAFVGKGKIGKVPMIVENKPDGMDLKRG